LGKQEDVMDIIRLEERSFIMNLIKKKAGKEKFFRTVEVILKDHSTYSRKMALNQAANELYVADKMYGLRNSFPRILGSGGFR